MTFLAHEQDVECDPDDMSASKLMISFDFLDSRLPQLEVKDAWELTPVTPLGLQKLTPLILF